MDYIIELENNNNVLRLMMEIEQGNISLDDAVAQNIDLLRAMKSENDVAGSVYAAILLDKAKIEPMTEVIRLPEPAVEQKNAVVDKSSNFNTSFSDLVNIHPNPATNEFNFELPTDIKIDILEIYSTNGAVIYQQNVQPGTNKINIESLPVGMYLVRIRGANLYGKFVKE